MKFGLILTLIFISSFACVKQASDLKLVHVKDWGEVGVMTKEDFWNSSKQDIISKVGEEQYEKIVKYSNGKNMPGALLLWDGHKIVPLEEYKKRMSTLKTYKVVTFDYEFQGSIIQYAAIAVPYQKLNWDSTAKWDTVYYSIKQQFIEENK